MQAVLIVGGGILPSYLVREAQAMELYAIVTGTSAEAPACALADEYHLLDPLDGEGHATLAAELRESHVCQLRGVCTAGADNAPTVARAAAAAGLPGIPVDVADRTHDKWPVRLALEKAGLSCYQPRWASVVKGDTSAELTATHLPFVGGYPVVVKPRTQRASRGLSIVRSAEDLDAAMQKALAYGDDYLIEECLVGTEHSAEALLGEDGTLVWFNIVDRLFSYEGGLALETGHVNPTSLSDHAQQQIQLMLLSAARALGVTWGAFKLDVMLTAEGPKVLEATARLSGGWDCQGTSPLTGRHPMRQLLQLSCSLPVEPQAPPQGYAACAAILPHQTGVVHQLSAGDVPHGAVIWCIKPGDTLERIAHNGARPGFVLTHAQEYQAAWDTAKGSAESLAADIQIHESRTGVTHE